jgi:type VI protein secretion system component VasK
MQAREQKLMANLRVLEQKRHHDGQFEQQESALFDALARHSAWLRNSSFWWAGIIVTVAVACWVALQDVAMAAINLQALGMIACFGVVVFGLAALSCVRVWRVRRALTQLLSHRQALKAAIAAQGAETLAQVNTASRS